MPPRPGACCQCHDLPGMVNTRTKLTSASQILHRVVLSMLAASLRSLLFFARVFISLFRLLSWWCCPFFRFAKLRGINHVHFYLKFFQVTSIADYSTNYCNSRMLYCGFNDGCKPVNLDLGAVETKVPMMSFALVSCISALTLKQ